MLIPQKDSVPQNRLPHFAVTLLHWEWIFPNCSSLICYIQNSVTLFYLTSRNTLHSASRLRRQRSISHISNLP